MQIKSLSLLAGAALGLSGSLAMAQQSTDEVRAVVSEMMADAETRSSLLSGGDAGHDGRFFIAGDGFRLNIGGYIQTRYYMNFRDEGEVGQPGFGDPQDDFTHGFYMSRVKVDFSGELNKDWFYRVRLGASSASNPDADSSESSGVNFDYAYGGYKFANGMKVTFGQFKLPLLREELIADTKGLAVERSMVNDLFSQGYSQGIQFSHEYETWRWCGAFSDGVNSANTNWTSQTNTSGFITSGQAEYALTGRFEFLFSGAWKQFEDFTSPKGSDFGFMMGAAAHWQQSTQTPVITDNDQNMFEFTVDASLKGDSWNIYGAFVGRQQDNRAAGVDSDYFDMGAIVQGGWRFAENTELFGRWDAVFFDDDRGTNQDSSNFITVGVNQYFAGHAAKATLDLIWAVEETSELTFTGGVPNTQIGILGENSSGEVCIRMQLQVVF